MMNDQLSFGQQIIAEELRVQRLLQDVMLVGGIYTMGFEKCLVLTNDLWKHRAGGIPKHCFLTATAMQPGEAPQEPEDEEVILLRVVGPASLPAEDELVAVRAEAMKEIVTTQGVEASGAVPAILDVLTRNEIQFSALQAKILGTFYDSEVEGQPVLAFGSDIETFYSASRYRVYKPYGRSLSIIASYPEVTLQEMQDGDEPTRVRIGTIRYTSSLRRHQRESEQPTTVPVRINIEDFIAMKTAVFGMTRMGKSNTMKILATAIFQHSQETGEKIGQLLFDPAGEYANVNVQDQTALAQIGSDHVTVFRFGAGDDEPGVKGLSTNFFEASTVDVTWSIIYAYLSHKESNYIQSFLAANVIGPEQPQDDYSAWHRAKRRRAALYATLLRAGFRPPQNFSARFAANRDVVNEVNRVLEDSGKEPIESDDRGNLRLSADQLEEWMEALIEARNTAGFPDDWIDSQMDAILTFFAGTVGSGYRLLEPLRIFHSSRKVQDYADQVLEDLVDGRIVIVDLSLGSETVLKFISERIINHIVSYAARRFADGKEPRNLQIYLEEAHRLFNRDRFARPAEADPYVRLAKEAAKFKIGLIYATQEVTSVDPIILANTSNWIITHLNNRIEVKELSKYYNFEDFSELTLKAEDVGFVRLKTRSGRYIVPTQIDLFDAGRIQAARQALRTEIKTRER
jgi:hypothetical protein